MSRHNLIERFAQILVIAVLAGGGILCLNIVAACLYIISPSLSAILAALVGAGAIWAIVQRINLPQTRPKFHGNSTDRAVSE